MLQFPAFMRQYPSPTLIPSSTLIPLWAQSHNDEVLLSLVESELEDKWKDIRETNNDIVVIGNVKADNKEELDADAEDDDADNAEESEGDDFEQETG